MNATGRTDHHVDPDLDAEQVLGFVPQDRTVLINPLSWSD
jgi:hypothetical protein